MPWAMFSKSQPNPLNFERKGTKKWPEKSWREDSKNEELEKSQNLGPTNVKRSL